MAVKIELHADTARVALEAYLASLKRALNTTKQPAFKPIIEKDIAAVQLALGSISEIGEPPKK